MSQEIQKIKDALYIDSSIKEFCIKHKLNDEEFINNINKFFIQKENNLICNNCDGTTCKMDPYGMQTKIVYEEKIDIKYFNCPKIEIINLNYLDVLYFPQIEEINDKKIIKNLSRALALKSMSEFSNKYQKGMFIKGIYFYGSFGTGKTFLMYKLAKDLAKKNIRVLIAYYPDLIRFIKSSITTNELETTIRKLKNVDVLMLDDIGAESNSNFIRDEVLGPILQFRLESNLPVCMTSNLNLDLLKEHFSESKDEINKIKSDRIIERIRYLMNAVELDDKNYRL